MAGHREIRRSRASDAEAMFEIRSQPATRRFQPMIPGSPASLQRTLVERGTAPLAPEQAGKVQWTIVVDENPAGWVTVDVTQRAHHIASLGYSVDSRLHGRGLATWAVRQVAQIAFDPNGLAIERLEAVAAIENSASRRVLEKCGFSYEGVARGYLILSGERVDHARYARLHNDG